MTKDLWLEIGDKIMFYETVIVEWSNWKEYFDWGFIVMNVENYELFLIEDGDSISIDKTDLSDEAIRIWKEEEVIKIKKLKNTEINKDNFKKLFDLYNEAYHWEDKGENSHEYHYELLDLAENLEYWNK